MGNCVEDNRMCVNHNKFTEKATYLCNHCNLNPNFSNHFKPRPKRIPVTPSIKDHNNPGHLHITTELYQAIKQAYPKGYIEIP